MRRSLVIAALCVMMLGLSLEAWAEVRAITDRSGNYRTTRVLTRHDASSHRLEVASRTPSIWRPVGRGGGALALNPGGDLTTDSWPVIAEPRQRPHHPWVFWSRMNGTHYDLAWSKWTRSGWTPVNWLYPGIPGDDLDPEVVFDDTGRPYVAWWTNRDGSGQIFFSMFLETRWMTPLRISDGSVDARHPMLSITPTEITIGYRTPDGSEVFELGFARPTTITDDIDPLDYVSEDANIAIAEVDP